MFTRFLAGYIARHRRNRFSHKVDQIARSLHAAYENHNYDFFSNGEHWVLTTIKSHIDVKTVFDVGANVGEWTAIASCMFPEARVHSFEIVPETYERLSDRCRGMANVSAHNFGLADAPGTVPVYCSADRSNLATCVPQFIERFHKFKPATIEAEVTSGDHFCSVNDIAKLDILKIDVEGSEPIVLKGFEGMLKRGAIQTLQFEYGYANISTRFLLKDFYELLKGYDMSVGKVYPNYVSFRDYQFEDEDFLGPNYLAVRSSLGPLIEALS